jgi:hypothetical protein
VIVKVTIRGKEMNIRDYSKIDHKTLHFLPFVPTTHRKKNFALMREWGNLEMIIKAYETLNTYDLFTLLYIVKEYVVNGYDGGYLKIKLDGKEIVKEIAGITINIDKFLEARGISKNMNNKKTLINSINRLKSIDLTFIGKTSGKVTRTSYIYEFEINKRFTEVAISANKKFIEFVINNGILVNLERLQSYGKREQYAILLDLYLQGNKIKIENKKRTKYIYREKFTNKEIEQVLKLDLTKMKKSDKKEKIEKTFELLHTKGKLPLYKYSKTDDMWVKTFEEEIHE